MEYALFMMRLREELAVYVHWVEEFFSSKCAKEEAERYLSYKRHEMARILNEFEKEGPGDIKLCPCCNAVVERDGKQEVMYPGKVGNKLEYENNILYGVSGYCCPTCNYQRFHKIEHWE